MSGRNSTVIYNGLWDHFKNLDVLHSLNKSNSEIKTGSRTLSIATYFTVLKIDILKKILSHTFPISCSFSSPSGTPMMQMLDFFKLSQRLLILSSFGEILFSSCSDCLLFASHMDHVSLSLCFCSPPVLGRAALIPCLGSVA
ncbi:hypothetical protein HJG60_011299 [Phyllostomus discolor]|uniref:Uncharacterized protein n=1 Tax=Phyllostomus discolor TaxID=89673 RepID=A0A834A2C8_9CHIR|nr:hypothetical protein HJG60_011299 [Phyllostomus discolor]